MEHDRAVAPNSRDRVTRLTLDRVVTVIGLALLMAGVDAGLAIRDPFASMIDLLPGWAVDAAYEAVSRGLHVAAAVVAALILATALATAAIRSARDGRRPADAGECARLHTAM